MSYAEARALGYKPITEKRAWEIKAEFEAKEVPRKPEPVWLRARRTIQWAEEYERDNPPEEKDFDLAPGMYFDGSGRLAFGTDLDELKRLLPEFERAYESDAESCTYLAMQIGQLCERLQGRLTQDDAARGKRCYSGSVKGKQRRTDQAAGDRKAKAKEIRKYLAEYRRRNPEQSRHAALLNLEWKKKAEDQHGWSCRRLQQILHDYPA